MSFTACTTVAKILNVQTMAQELTPFSLDCKDVQHRSDQMNHGDDTRNQDIGNLVSWIQQVQIQTWETGTREYHRIAPLVP